MRVFLLRLLVRTTAGRLLEPDLARSGLTALHPKAAAALAALQRGRGHGPQLVAELAAALLAALPQVVCYPHCLLPAISCFVWLQASVLIGGCAPRRSAPGATRLDMSGY